jgi:hypothetical protein
MEAVAAGVNGRERSWRKGASRPPTITVPRKRDHSRREATGHAKIAGRFPERSHQQITPEQDPMPSRPRRTSGVIPDTRIFSRGVADPKSTVAVMIATREAGIFFTDRGNMIIQTRDKENECKGTDAGAPASVQTLQLRPSHPG